MDDVVFPESEVDIDLVPVGALTSGRRTSLPQIMDLSTCGWSVRLEALDHAFEAPDQNVRAPRLADDVDRASVES